MKRAAIMPGTLFAIALLTSLATMPARAQNMGTAFETVWSGLYLGAHAGYGAGYAFQDIAFPATDVGINISGFTVGASAQYLWQAGNFTFGPQGEIFWSSASGERAVGANNFFQSELDWAGSFGAKAGIALGDVLIFGTAGVAVAGVSGGQTNLLLSRHHTESQVAIGYSVGLGIDLMLDNGWVVGSEYRYYDFAPARMFAGSPLGFQSRSVDVNLHSASLHLRKKLN